MYHPSATSARRERQRAENLAAFEKDNAKIAGWWRDNASRFAQDMREKVMRFGSLTAGQMAACIRCANKFGKA